MQKNSRDMGEISTHGTHWNLRHVHCTEKKLKCALGFKHHKLCTIFQVFWHQLCVWNRLKANMLKVNKTGILSAKMALILACSLKNATECFNRFFFMVFLSSWSLTAPVLQGMTRKFFFQKKKKSNVLCSMGKKKLMIHHDTSSILGELN